MLYTDVCVFLGAIHLLCILNIDGTKVKGWDKGGIGGLIRDDRGLKLGIFSEKIGGGPSILAELLAIKRGCSLIEELGSFPTQRIILESDSTTALKWIKNPDLCTPLFQSLVRGVANYVEGKGIILRHIVRAAKWEADELAKADVLLSEVTPQILRHVRSCLSSNTDVVETDAFESNPESQLWLKIMEAITDPYTVERVAEQLLRQLATERASDIEAYLDIVSSFTTSSVISQVHVY
ncbi:Detected protein of unknown function [Hibiscus syriacus]|uniref:Uncharacterized protein n=1 Tax=Hibiscus syriacus TaxID=106335 RepID=A0A6A3C921_HIBSY|nr:Detected protein of unknown function [Hibiscus syriacus]